MHANELTTNMKSLKQDIFKMVENNNIDELIAKVESGEIPSVECRTHEEYLNHVNA